MTTNGARIGPEAKALAAGAKPLTGAIRIAGTGDQSTKIWRNDKTLTREVSPNAYGK